MSQVYLLDTLLNSRYDVMTIQTRFELEIQYKTVKKHNHDKDCYVLILLDEFGLEAYSFSIENSFSNILVDHVTFQTTPSPGRAKDLVKMYPIGQLPLSITVN